MLWACLPGVMSRREDTPSWEPPRRPSRLEQAGMDGASGEGGCSETTMQAGAEG